MNYDQPLVSNVLRLLYDSNESQVWNNKKKGLRLLNQ